MPSTPPPNPVLVSSSETHEALTEAQVAQMREILQIAFGKGITIEELRRHVEDGSNEGCLARVRSRRREEAEARSAAEKARKMEENEVFWKELLPNMVTIQSIGVDIETLKRIFLGEIQERIQFLSNEKGLSSSPFSIDDIKRIAGNISTRSEKNAEMSRKPDFFDNGHKFLLTSDGFLLECIKTSIGLDFIIEGQ